MLSSRCLLLQCSCTLKRLSISCKYANYKEYNIIKFINTENKYLYGKLLESQKQRRKGLSKLLGTSPKRNEKVVIEDDLDGNLQSSENETVLKQRVKKSKGSKTLTPDCTKNYLTSNTRNLSPEELAHDPLVLASKPSNRGISNKMSKMVRTSEQSEDLKSSPSVDVNKITAEVSKATSVPSKEFVFTSSVVINDINYPLENKLKLLADSSNIKNVLSYGFNDPAIKQYIKFPSVSKIIEETMSDKNKLILRKWRQSMIRDLGEDGFNKYSEDLKVRGQEFHTAMRNTILGKPTDESSQTAQNALKSLSWMLEHISSPMAVESMIAHPLLGYKGIPDCVALFRNIPVVIDWKLSDKPKKELKDTYEAPVQITAYIGALNHDPNYKWGVNHGLVAVAYDSGDPCDVFLLAPKHCEVYWRHWLMRFEKFKARSHLHLEHNIDENSLKFT